MNKKLLTLGKVFALVLSGTLLLTGCSVGAKTANTSTPTAGATAGSVVKLRFGNTAVQGTTLYDASNLFKKEVEEKSKGTIQVDYLSAGVLGGDAQVLQQVVAGTTDLNVTDLGLFTSYEPKLAVLTLPFMYTSLEQAWKVMDSNVASELTNRLVSKGLHPLAFWENGFRDLTTSKKPVRTPEDVKGMKLRVPEIDSFVQLWKTLGANPTPMDLSQVYMSLQQGVVEGQENPLEITYNNKLYEVQKYLILTHHVYSPTLLVISEKTWQKLTPEQQKVLVDAAKDVSKYHREATQKHADQLLTLMKQKMTVIQPNIAAFQKAAEPMYSWADQKFGTDTVKAVRDEAAKDK